MTRHVSLANLADRHEAALVSFEEDHEGVPVANLNHPVLRRRLSRRLVHLPEGMERRNDTTTTKIRTTKKIQQVGSC